MRRIAFFLSLALIFIVPWEDSITIPAFGSLARLLGLTVSIFWVLTVMVELHFRRPHLFHFLVFLFLLWVLLGAFWTVDVDRTLQRIATYFQIFLLMFIIWDLYTEAAAFLAALQAYVLGGFVSIASTIFNYLRGIDSVPKYAEGRYSATGVNAVDLALLLLLGLPLAWYLYESYGRNRRVLKLINLSYIPLAIYAIILTGSRAALFGGIPFLLYVLWPKGSNLKRRLLILSLLALTVLLLLPYVPSSISDRFATTSDSIRSADMGGRVSLWRHTLTVFSDYPLLGGGSNTLFYPLLGSDAHNTFLSVLAETGLIGFLSFLSIVAVVFYQAVKLAQSKTSVWLTVFFTWAIGASMLSWEFRKPTWLFMSFVLIQAALVHPSDHSVRVYTSVHSPFRTALFHRANQLDL